ncbi:hypothetical protein D9M68_707750 [compost metagenome]
MPQPDRLARHDADDQAQRIALADLADDLRLVVTQGLRGFFCLRLGHPAKTLQGVAVALAQAADIAFHVRLERGIGRLHPYHQARLGQ